MKTATVTTVSEKFAYSISEVAILTTLSKSYIRQEIKNQKLKTRRIGRRVLILPDDLRAFLNGFAPEKGGFSNE